MIKKVGVGFLLGLSLVACKSGDGGPSDSYTPSSSEPPAKLSLSFRSQIYRVRAGEDFVIRSDTFYSPNNEVPQVKSKEFTNLRFDPEDRSLRGRAPEVTAYPVREDITLMAPNGDSLDTILIIAEADYFPQEQVNFARLKFPYNKPADIVPGKIGTLFAGVTYDFIPENFTQIKKARSSNQFGLSYSSDSISLRAIRTELPHLDLALAPLDPFKADRVESGQLRIDIQDLYEKNLKKDYGLTDLTGRRWSQDMKLAYRVEKLKIAPADLRGMRSEPLVFGDSGTCFYAGVDKGIFCNYANRVVYPIIQGPDFKVLDDSCAATNEELYCWTVIPDLGGDGPIYGLKNYSLAKLGLKENSTILALARGCVLAHHEQVGNQVICYRYRSFVKLVLPDEVVKIKADALIASGEERYVKLQDGRVYAWHLEKDLAQSHAEAVLDADGKPLILSRIQELPMVASAVVSNFVCGVSPKEEAFCWPARVRKVTWSHKLDVQLKDYTFVDFLGMQPSSRHPQTDNLGPWVQYCKRYASKLTGRREVFCYDFKEIQRRKDMTPTQPFGNAEAPYGRDQCIMTPNGEGHLEISCLIKLEADVSFTKTMKPWGR